MKFIGGRFNFGEAIDPDRFEAFPALYLAENAETATYEKFGMLPDEKTNGLSALDLGLAKGGITYVVVAGRIGRVFDLRRQASLNAFARIIRNFRVPRSAIDATRELKRIKRPRLIRSTAELNKSLMDPDWRTLPSQFSVPANCQVFGELLRAAGFEGILYKSVRTNGNCLAIFTCNLQSTSWVKLVGPTPDNASDELRPHY